MEDNTEEVIKRLKKLEDYMFTISATMVYIQNQIKICKVLLEKEQKVS